MYNPFDKFPILKFKDRKQKESIFKENFILIVNPQGCIGLKALNYMNYPGTTCFGGQISYVLNLADSLAKIKHSKEDSRQFQVRILSQRVEKNFNKDFEDELETTNNYFVDRFYMSKEFKNYIDKEAIFENKNNYYYHLQFWGRVSAKTYFKLGKIPSNIILNYWDSYVAFSYMIEYWKNHGVINCPTIVCIPHSLGFRKLISTLVSKVKPKLASNLNLNVCYEIILSNLKELLDDEKVLYPQRILTERIMISNESFIACVNSQTEKEQLLIGPYGLKFRDYPVVKAENVNVIYPGIDTLRFGKNSNFMESFELSAKNKYLERKTMDISKDRHNFAIILAVGRLHFDKNFHSLVIAFKESMQLKNNSNLVFIVNGPENGKNENYIIKMQKALRNGVNELNGFYGSSLEQLINLANILDCVDLKGKWTSISLPDGREYAGIQRYLGKEGKTISGLFSLKEPYGLSPWENIYVGIPVVVSKNSGVAEELIHAGAYSFNPTQTYEIANALMKTLENYDELKKKLTAASLNKDWCETTNQLMRYIDKKPKFLVNSSKINPIDINDPSFIKDGKDLIIDSIKNEYKLGSNGELKELFEIIIKKEKTEELTKNVIKMEHSLKLLTIKK